MNIIALDTLVAARLEFLNKTSAKLLRKVGNAADLDEAERSNASASSVFAVPLAEKATRSPYVDVFVQPKLIGVRVISVVSNKASDKAVKANLAGVRSFVHESLVGWLPAGCDEAMYWIEGGLLQLNGASLWWHDDFIVRQTVLFTDSED